MVKEDTTTLTSPDKAVKREDNNHQEVKSLIDHTEAEVEVSDHSQETILTSKIEDQ